MNLQNIKIGIKVRINNRLESAVGMIVYHRHIISRRPNISGIVVDLYLGMVGIVGILNMKI